MLGKTRWRIAAEVGPALAFTLLSQYEVWAGPIRHLQEEKTFTQERDRLSQARRDMPWELVEKQYVFDGRTGRQTLSDLFNGRSQLVIYHAMFDPANAD